jgi:putative ABC transport system ATP-binding protein
MDFLAPGHGGVALRGVVKRHGRGRAAVVALDGVDASFGPGTFTAVMGPSGSGKSTLLQCAAGLDRPDEGTVVVAGTDLGQLSEAQLARLRRASVGFVFQSFNLLPSLTAAENVALPLRLAGTRVRRRVLEDALARVGLEDRAGHRPSELSGGQQQRVAIARALLHRPAVVFADEPTGALDSVSARRTLGLLRALVDGTGGGEHRPTVVMVTHDPVAAASADSVLFLADGRIVGGMCRPTPEAVAQRMVALEREVA